MSIALEQLRPFCGSDDTRVALHTPCTKDGFTWATDGRILIRVPAIDGVTDVANYPDIKAVWGQFDPDADFHPLPPLPVPTREKCWKCHGLGEDYCDSCDNWNECKRCGGAGEIEDRRWARIDGVPFKIIYLAKIATLPNARIAVTVRDKEAKTETGESAIGATASFICDGGGCGLLMSLSETNYPLDESLESEAGGCAEK